MALVPIVGALVAASVLKGSLAVYVQTAMFALLLLASFVHRPERSA